MGTWLRLEGVKVILECACGGERMRRLRAGPRTTCPGEFFYPCPNGIEHTGRFRWATDVAKSDDGLAAKAESKVGNSETCPVPVPDCIAAVSESFPTDKIHVVAALRRRTLQWGRYVRQFP